MEAETGTVIMPETETGYPERRRTGEKKQNHTIRYYETRAFIVK